MITDELYDVIFAKVNNAYHAWILLDAFFRDNLAGRTAMNSGPPSRATSGLGVLLAPQGACGHPG